MPKVVLKEYKSWRDWLPLREIRVQPNQRKFTTNLITSYLQSTHPAVTGYGLYMQETLIGYVFLIHADNPAQWIIDRLTIDKDYQRQGYGYDVIDQLVDMVYDFENSETVIARYNTDNDAARQLIAKLKFEEQEQLVRGRNIATLEFEFEESEEEDDDEDDDYDEDDYEDEEDEEIDNTDDDDDYDDSDVDDDDSDVDDDD